MYFNFFIVFLLHQVSADETIHKLGDRCVTEDNQNGVYRYAEECRGNGTIRPVSEGPTNCRSESCNDIVCCQINTINNAESGLSNPQESPLYPKHPHIEIPASLQTPAQVVAFEKCFANDRRVNPCAMSNSSSKFDVGTPVALKELPHLAVLGCDYYNSIKWVGFGSLLSKKYILTAAHLLDSLHGYLQHALLGSVGSNGGKLFSIIRRIPHVSYSLSHPSPDIGLVELDRPVVFSELIRPICLPVPAIVPEDSTRLVAGWEVDNDSSNITRIFQVHISELNATECDIKLKPLWRFRWNNESMICAQGRKDRYKKVDCFGHAGIPLMYKVQEESICNYVVAGVTFYGYCEGEAPTMYTKVAPYLDWIVEVVWPEELRNATARARESV